MAQHGFQMGGHSGNAIDPSNLMAGSYQGGFQGSYSGGSNGGGFTGGSAVFADDELLDGLDPMGSPSDQQGGVHGHGQEYTNMGEMSMAYAPGLYSTSHHGLPMDQAHVNGYSSTPDGDPMASPFVNQFSHQYHRSIQPQSFGNIQSPLSYGGSPLPGSEMNDGGESGFLGAKGRPTRLAQSVPQRAKAPVARSPLTPKTAAMAGLSMNSDTPYGAQPIRTGGAHHEKSNSGQWMQTPNSLSSFPGSGFSSPLNQGLHNVQLNEMLMKGGASMPAKLGGPSTAVSSQEAKRKRRRESHNLVERRRRDNINERIQDLSKLVPAHRLEDEKIRKAIQNGTPLSPTLAGISSPTQATSTLAGPGARRATGGTAGNITTGLPIEDKDKGPNKGDILNGAVSWTRDLMWMLHLKLQQQEELINSLVERGGRIPFEITDDERRMQTELMEAISKSEEGEPKVFSYSRTAGSGLRVPHHTNYKGEPLNGNGHSADHVSISPDGDDISRGTDMLDTGDFLEYDDDDLTFKEEDEYGGMDLTQ
ncbi:hypothetical protein OQA88_6798 [Cercophora sp. LCS_1]